MPSPFFRRTAFTFDRVLTQVADAFEFTRGRVRRGSFVLAFYPRLVSELCAPLRDRTLLITGTNGKTTTGRLLARILRRANQETLHNEAGAGTIEEVAATLMAAAPYGTLRARYGVFGVHDTVLAEAAALFSPRIITMTNLYPDGVEREGGVDAVIRDWRACCSTLRPDRHILLNADDPLLSGGFVRGVPARIVYFGVEDLRLGIASRASGMIRCHRCGAFLTYRHVALSHLGDYGCGRCGWERPMPTVYAIDVETTAAASRFRIITPVGPLDVHLRLPGVYNIYNAVAATAAAVTLGVNAATIRAGLESATPASGRGECVVINNRTARLVLIKNPTGMHEALRTALLDTTSQHYMFLFDHAPEEEEDISWIWDVDFEVLAGHAASVIVSGSGVDHLVLCLKHAGVEATEVNPDPLDAFYHAIERLPQDGRLWVMATAGALSELRQEVADFEAAR